MKNKNIIYWALACIAVIATASVVVGTIKHKQQAAISASTGQTNATSTTSTKPAPTAEEQQVRAVVEKFGSRMKNVSVLSLAAADDIRTQYQGIVSDDILTFWQKNPIAAPGRRTSSPWPDRIDIQNISKADDGSYDVQGLIIEVTSTSIDQPTGEAALSQQVGLKLRNRDGAWIITGYQSIAPAATQ